VCVCVYAWIIEHEELDWKHAFTGLNLGFAGSACVYLRVKLYPTVQRCAAEQSSCGTRGATVYGHPIINLQRCIPVF